MRLRALGCKPEAQTGVAAGVQAELAGGQSRENRREPEQVPSRRFSYCIMELAACSGNHIHRSLHACLYDRVCGEDPEQKLWVVCRASPFWSHNLQMDHVFRAYTYHKHRVGLGSFQLKHS